MKTWAFSVAVVVKNKERARRFYVEKLGMKVLDDMEHWLTVGQPRRGARIHLCETTPLEPGNTGIILSVDQKIEDAYRELKRKGVKFSVPPTEREWGVECRLLDPDGNELFVMEA
ncbi:MAG: VOC family protein [Deltaproteobacteria bacterium]|nr:VOC family protein [Deltaproteobacteria bacterium]